MQINLSTVICFCTTLQRLQVLLQIHNGFEYTYLHVFKNFMHAGACTCMPFHFKSCRIKYHTDRRVCVCTNFRISMLNTYKPLRILLQDVTKYMLKWVILRFYTLNRVYQVWHKVCSSQKETLLNIYLNDQQDDLSLSACLAKISI